MVFKCNATDTEVEIAQKSKRFIVNPVITSYIDSIYKRSEQEGIKIVFLIPPLNQASYKVLQHSRFFKEYITFRESLRLRYPKMTVDNNHVFLPNRYFHDSGHLNQRGVRLFSSYIRRQMEAL